MAYIISNQCTDKHYDDDGQFERTTKKMLNRIAIKGIL